MPESFDHPSKEKGTQKLLQNPFLDPEKIRQVFSTPKARQVFDNIDAATIPRREAIEHKQCIALEIRDKQLLNEEILKKHPVVYVGSGTDFEYPLSLGGRHIIMVDPIFENETDRQALEDRFKKSLGREPAKISEHKWQFEFDFGTGSETVRVEISPAFYGSRETGDPFQSIFRRVAEVQKREGIVGTEVSPTQNQLSRFKPPENIGLILGFRTVGMDFDKDPEAMENIVKGGYVLTDNAFGSFLQSASEKEKNEHIYSDSPKKPIELMRRKWKERGYDFITLESEEGSYHYTFLKKP